MWEPRHLAPSCQTVQVRPTLGPVLFTARGSHSTPWSSPISPLAYLKKTPLPPGKKRRQRSGKAAPCPLGPPRPSVNPHFPCSPLPLFPRPSPSHAVIAWRAAAAPTPACTQVRAEPEALAPRPATPRPPEAPQRGQPPPPAGDAERRRAAGGRALAPPPPGWPRRLPPPSLSASSRLPPFPLPRRREPSPSRPSRGRSRAAGAEAAAAAAVRAVSRRWRRRCGGPAEPASSGRLRPAAQGGPGRAAACGAARSWTASRARPRAPP